MSEITVVCQGLKILMYYYSELPQKINKSHLKAVEIL